MKYIYKIRFNHNQVKVTYIESRINQKLVHYFKLGGIYNKEIVKLFHSVMICKDYIKFSFKINPNKFHRIDNRWGLTDVVEEVVNNIKYVVLEYYEFDLLFYFSKQFTVTKENLLQTLSLLRLTELQYLIVKFGQYAVYKRYMTSAQYKYLDFLRTIGFYIYNSEIDFSGFHPLERYRNITNKEILTKEVLNV